MSRSRMKSHLLPAAVLLLFASHGHACEPGTLENEDTFFKYCDEARNAAVTEFPVAEKDVAGRLIDASDAGPARNTKSGIDDPQSEGASKTSLTN